jgi:hypothetical protein
MYGKLTFVSPVPAVAVWEQKTLKKKLAKGVWDMTKQKVDVQVQDFPYTPRCMHRRLHTWVDDTRAVTCESGFVDSV